MWGQIAQAIAKVYDSNEQTKRQILNNVASTKDSGEGNNGQSYQTTSSNGGGGSPEGYKKPSDQDMSGTNNATNQIGNIGNKLSNLGQEAMSQAGKDDDSSSSGGDSSSTNRALGTMANTMGNNSSSLGGSTSGEGVGSVMGVVGTQMPTSSDERLKRIFGDNEDAIDVFSKINAIEFEYNDKAKEIHPDGENNVDDDVHYGIKAQDLEKSPITSSVVSEDDYGYKQVNTDELTMVNSAVISDLCKRIKILENILGVKVV